MADWFWVLWCILGAILIVAEIFTSGFVLFWFGIGALAAAYDIPVIPHTGGTFDCVHFVMATPNSPWAELFMPPPGGPDEVYRRFEADNQITRGPEGIYTRPSDRPGFGWDIEVT